MHFLTSDPAHRTAGQYARATVKRLRLRTLVWLGALAVETAAAGRIFGLHDVRFYFAEIALLVSMFVISHFVLPTVDRRDRGATGEEHVGALLDSFCGEDWQVLHDVSLGHGNIDHILIGPGGVYTIETKSHEGPIRVSRVHGATLEQARAQRKGVEGMLGLHTEPLIVYSRAWVDRPLARRKEVRLLPARMLLRYLQKRPPRLTSAEVAIARERIVNVLLEEQAPSIRARLHIAL